MSHSPRCSRWGSRFGSLHNVSSGIKFELGSEYHNEPRYEGRVQTGIVAKAYGLVCVAQPHQIASMEEDRRSVHRNGAGIDVPQVERHPSGIRATRQGLFNFDSSVCPLFFCNIISLCFIQEKRGGSLGGDAGADEPEDATPRGNFVDKLAVVALAIADPAFMAEHAKFNTGIAPEERTGFLTEGAGVTNALGWDNLAGWLQDKRDSGDYADNPLDADQWPDLMSIVPSAADTISGTDLKTLIRKAISYTDTVKFNFHASGYGTSGWEAYVETFAKMDVENEVDPEIDYYDHDGLEGRDHSQASLT